ncbi:MAG: UDP-N-acetylmuramoyl-tripeptide--D-alanyl-D-alanine ligase [Chitinophagaceae bacterium]|nr:UDP-N-acetylmuramoyl-tripeptide--D-alanyl-D-alanine ligase [Chitinophagaceae bacterium]
MQMKELYALYLKYPNVQTDTRKLRVGDIFFALKGEHYNGNLFAKKALEQGAAYAVIDEDLHDHDQRLIKVDHVLTTLQQLALHHRKQFNIPFLAITGSNGKTTTKELIHAVLSSTYKTSTTEGNLNNHIGVPLTILKVKPDTEIAVIEMGANHQKEIASYCSYTLPNFGLINNCGKAHLEGFGGIEGVRKGKGELYDFIRSTDGTIFINTDYDYLRDMSRGISNQISYGTQNAETTGVLIASEPFLKVQISSTAFNGSIATHLVGDYNLPNVLAAVSTGIHFNVPANDIKKAIENYIPTNSRSQLIQQGTNSIILDAYNANPSSMKAAIENFARLQAPQKVVMLGGMAEMGEASMEEHQAVVDLLNQYPWHEVVLVGGDFGKTEHSYNYFQTASEAKHWLQLQELNHTHILIKGSRSMKMEEVL